MIFLLQEVLKINYLTDLRCTNIVPKPSSFAYSNRILFFKNKINKMLDLFFYFRSSVFVRRKKHINVSFLNLKKLLYDFLTQSRFNCYMQATVY